jgi:hypothetical protein
MATCSAAASTCSEILVFKNDQFSKILSSFSNCKLFSKGITYAVLINPMYYFSSYLYENVKISIFSFFWAKIKYSKDAEDFY